MDKIQSEHEQCIGIMGNFIHISVLWCILKFQETYLQPKIPWKILKHFKGHSIIIFGILKVNFGQKLH